MADDTIDRVAAADQELTGAALEVEVVDLIAVSLGHFLSGLQVLPIDLLNVAEAAHEARVGHTLHGQILLREAHEILLQHLGCRVRRGRLIDLGANLEVALQGLKLLNVRETDRHNGALL